MSQTDTGRHRIGFWTEGHRQPAFYPRDILPLLGYIRQEAYVIADEKSGRIGVAVGGRLLHSGGHDGAGQSYPVLGILAPQYPEWLGDRSFQEVHGVRFPYVGGEMAYGIASEEMVIELSRHNMLGFFGSAGLSDRRIEQGIDAIARGTGGKPWGINLIHTPDEPQREELLVDLYLHKNVRRVSASAFMKITPAIVRYAARGLESDGKGGIRRKHHLFAKISRRSLAAQFMSPPPAAILQELVGRGKLSAAEAAYAAQLPLAEDITVEADSGGHTDNRPMGALFPAVLKVREECMRRFSYPRPIRIGAAGGIGTPVAAAAAFAYGAAYILVGTVHQAAVESGLSEAGKAMLAGAAISDVAMAPAADMFEQGVRVQVLKRGTMFSARAAQLYDIYRKYPSLDQIPEDIRQKIEDNLFKAPIERVWEDTVRFFQEREPGRIERAQRDPKHKMALVFRWYLGNAGKWAVDGEKGRELDYQIFCGPAMGSFNAWAKGSFLEEAGNRTVGQIALNLLEGAAVVTRAQQLRSCGAAVPAEAFLYGPKKYCLKEEKNHGGEIPMAERR